METDPVAVRADTPVDEVALDFEKYDLVAMPVIDEIGRLVGCITVDDVMDEVRESSERDYQLASVCQATWKVTTNSSRRPRRVCHGC